MTLHASLTTTAFPEILTAVAAVTFISKVRTTVSKTGLCTVGAAAAEAG